MFSEASNHSKTNEDNVDSNGKNVTVIETEFSITNDIDGNTIDASKFKDALLAYLYSQVEFLKQVIEEKEV